MNRALAVVFTFLFLIIASFFFLWLRPVALPEPLKPVGHWFDERKSALVGDSTESEKSTAAAAISAAQSGDAKPEQVELASSRSTVAQVTVDGKGGSTVQSSAGADSTATGAQSALTAVASSKATQATKSAQSVVTNTAASVTGAEKAADDKLAQGTQAVTQAVNQAVTKASNQTTLASTSNAQSGDATPATASDASSLVGAQNGASAATNALAAASARSARRAAALEQVEKELGPAQTAVSNENPSQSASTQTAATASGNAARSDSPTANQASQPAPVALLKPEVKPQRPRTAAAVRQQQTITNYLEGRRVEFEVGRDVLSPRGTLVLDRLVPLIKANRGTSITIQGHTDDVGDYASNLELSGARAIAARNYLISRGIERRRLKVQGMGERLPIADNNTERGRIKNRRIDFAVSDAG